MVDPQNPGRDRWVRKRSAISLLMFVIGATSSLDYSLIGRVTVAETIAFASIPYFWLIGHRSYVNGNFKKCIGFLALIFFGVVIGDFINQTPTLFSARALARPVFILGFFLFFIPVLVRDPLSLVFMIYGRIVSGIINFYRPSEFQGDNAADAASYAGVVFRLEPLIGAVVVAFAIFIYPRSRIAAALSFFGGGVAVVIVGGARSSLLVWVLSATILIMISLLKSRRSRRIELTKRRLIGLGLVGLLALSAVYAFYLWAAPRGMLGEAQQQKMIDQQRTVFGTSPLGFILSGRPQVYGAILGILDRPIIGFGSWRHDLTSSYVVEAIASVGTDPRVIDRLNQGGATGAGHSVLFQSWVENGILTAIGYIAAFVILLKVFLFNIKNENRLTPYFVFIVIGFSWNFFFSPPGIWLRFIVGLFFAFYVVFADRRRPLSRMAVMS